MNIYENELIMLLIGFGVLILTLMNRARLRRIARTEILLLGFYVLLTAWVLTVLEGIFEERSKLWEAINILEHICYAISSIIVASWCYKAFGRGREVT